MGEGRVGVGVCGRAGKEGIIYGMNFGGGVCGGWLVVFYGIKFIFIYLLWLTCMIVIDCDCNCSVVIVIILSMVEGDFVVIVLL